MVKLVLGVDGLEYNLVEELKLDAIKQEAYTKLDLSDYLATVTPLIWSSMVTGAIDGDVNKEFALTPVAFGQYGFWGIRALRKILPLKWRKTLATTWERVRRKIAGNPMDKTLGRLKEKGVRTIFAEYGSKAWHNPIPGFDYQKPTSRKKELHKRSFEDPEANREFLEWRRKVYDDKIDKLWSVLEEKDDYELIFWYARYFDFLGHRFRGQKLKTIDPYMELNRIVSEVKEKLDPDDRLYIISDHGMDPKGRFGAHSDHAFFSSNTGELIEKPPELHDLLKKP